MIAKTELMRIAQVKEKYCIDNRGFGSLTDLGFSADTVGIDDDLAIVASGNGLYDITVTPATPGTTYTISVTAKNSQASDTGCASLSITQTGVRSPASCW